SFLCRQRLGVQEALAARARQACPVPACPGPVSLPGVRAVLQDDPGRVRGGPPVDIAAVMVKDGCYLTDRPGQPGQSLPRAGTPGPAGPAAAQPGRADPGQRSGVPSGRPASAVPATDIPAA